MTRAAGNHGDDPLRAEPACHSSGREIVVLTLAVIAIIGWNRSDPDNDGSIVADIALPELGST